MPTIIEPDFTENAERIFLMRYSMKDDDQKPTESGGEAVWRVASNVASVNAIYAAMNAPAEIGVRPTLLNEDEFPYRTARRRFDHLLGQAKTSDQAVEMFGVSHPRFLEVMEAGWYAAEKKDHGAKGENESSDHGRTATSGLHSIHSRLLVVGDL